MSGDPREVLGLDAGFGTPGDICAEISREYWQDVCDRPGDDERLFAARITKPGDPSGRPT